jgi:hypothetical protein
MQKEPRSKKKGAKMGLISSKVERINQDVMAIPMLNLSVGSGGALGARQSDTLPTSFAGDYVPIAVHYVDLHAYVYMIKQNGGIPIRSVALIESVVFQKERLHYHPDFFARSTTPSENPEPPRLKGGLVPPNSPVVSLVFRPFPSETVDIRFARVVSESKLSDVAQRMNVGVAAWNCGTLPTIAIDGTTLTITQKNGKDWRPGPLPRGPTLPPKALVTQQELGANMILLLSVNTSPWVGMQQGATGELSFAGEYLPISIAASVSAVTIVMMKRNGRTPVRETAMGDIRTAGGDRTLYHPDFYLAPSGKGAPTPIPGKRQASAPVVTIVRGLTPNATIKFGRVKSDAGTVPVAEATAPLDGRGFPVKIEWLQFTATLIRA